MGFAGFEQGALAAEVYWASEARGASFSCLKFFLETSVVNALAAVTEYSCDYLPSSSIVQAQNQFLQIKLCSILCLHHGHGHDCHKCGQ